MLCCESDAVAGLTGRGVPRGYGLDEQSLSQREPASAEPRRVASNVPNAYAFGPAALGDDARTCCSIHL